MTPPSARATLARRAALVCALLVGSVLSCVGDATGPEEGGGARGSVSFAPVFPQLPATTDPASLVEFNRVRIVLRRLDGSLALDTLVSFPDGAESITLTLDVTLSPGAPSTGEPMSLLLNYINAAGEIVFTGGPTQVLAVLPQPGQPLPPPITIPVRYTGPGSNAARVIISPRSLNVLEGDPFSFTGRAVDAAGTTIPNTPIVWSSLDPTRATLGSSNAGTGTALAVRGTARIVAQLLTGPADTVTVAVSLRARTIAAVSGSGQTAPAGTQLPQPLVVRVTASDGVPVAGVTVGFAVTTGGGSVGAASAVTDANGQAQTTWRLGGTTGAQSAAATAAGLTGSPVAFSATATQALPTRLAVTQQPTSGTAGAPLSAIRITAQDAQGNTATSFTGAVSVALGNNPGGSTLGGTTTVNAVAGVATFGTLTLNRVGSGYTLTATSAGLASATTAAFDVAPGAARVLEFDEYPTGAAAGVPFLVTVIARDSLHNIANGFSDSVSIRLAQSPAGATLSGSRTATAVGGQATFNLTPNTLGSYQLAVTAPGLSEVIGAAFQVGVGTPAGLVLLSGGGQTGPANGTLPQPIVVQVTDQFGNAVPAGGRSVTFAAGAGSGSVSPTAATTNANGQASTTWTLGPTVGTQSTTAASAGLTPNPLTVTATGQTTSGPGVRLAFSVEPSSVAAGSAITPAVVVQARDSAGALATTFTGNVTVALFVNPGQSTLSGTVTAAAVGGVATFSNLSLNRVATGYSLVTTSAALQSDTSAAFNVTPGAAARVAFTTQPVGGQAGSALPTQPAATVRDALGNTVTSFAGSVTVSLAVNPGAATLSGTATVAAVAGVATFTNLSLDKAAAGYRLAGASGALAADTSTAFTIVPGPMARLAFTVQPTAAQAGAPLVPAVQVTAQDAYGNTVPTFTGNVSLYLANNPSGASLIGTDTTTAVAGVATFPNVRVSAPGVGYTLGAVAGNFTGTSAAFTIGAASISWITPAGGNWSAAANWSLGRTPVASDSVTIALPGTYTVTLDVDFTGAFILLGGSSGTQTLSLTSRALSLSGGLSVGTLGAVAASSSTIGGAGAVSSQGLMTLTSTTVSAPLANAGLLVTQGSTQISGSFANAGGGTFRVQGSPTGGGAAITVGQGFLNNGAIEITDVSGAYGATLTVNGTLTNAVGATITSLQGTNGGRTLNAPLDNQGTLTVSGTQALSLNRASAQHTNSGTINVTTGDLTLTQSGTTPSLTSTGTIALGAGRTFSISGGTFNLNAGTLSGGTLSLASVTWNMTPSFTNATTALSFSSVTLNGPGTLTNAVGQTLTLVSSTINAPLVNNGTLNGQGSSSITGSFTAASGSTLRSQGSPNGGGASLTLSNGFTNNGAIEITDVSGAYGATLTVNGTLTNAVGATITSLQGANGGRALNAPLDNQGTLTVSGTQALSLNRASAQHTNSGTINVTTGDLTLTQSGTSPSLTSTGTIALSAGRTFSISGGTFNLNAGTLSGGTLSLASVTWNMTPSFTNATTALSFSSVTLNGPGTLTNAVGQTLTLVGSTINAPLVNNGTLNGQGSSSITGSFTAASGSTLRSQGSPNGGGASLTLSNGFTNNGAIEITDVSGAYGATLTVNGTLTNAVGATITSLQGANGGRTLTATLDNQGTLTVSGTQALSLNRASAQHTNSGTINVTTGDLTLTQSGTTPSLTSTGTIALGAGRTFSISGGTFNLNAGTLSGGTLSLASVTWNMTPSFTNATTALSFSSVTLNGPGTLTNAVGQTLTLVGSTINAPLVNNGTLNGQGSSSITGSFTAASGSTLRSQGSPNGGGASLTLSNGFTNNGAIEITDVSGAYGATLTVNGTLTNAVGATITSLQGTNGGRTLTATLNNQGFLEVAGTQGLVLNRANAAHTNSGRIDLTDGNLTLSQSGPSPSFTTTGTINIGSGLTFAVNGGTFTYSSGAFGGSGLLSFNNATANFTPNFTNAVIQLALTSSTLNGPGTIVNAAGQTLTITSSTINAPFFNVGTLVAQGSSTLAGSVSTDTSSVVRVQGAPAGGGANLTVSQPWTDLGDIQITDVGGAYGATLTLGGLLTSDSGATIQALAGAGGSRTIVGDITTLFGSTITLTPGSGGKLTVSGKATIGGSIVMDIGGTTQGGNYDLLVITGTLTLSNTFLYVTLFGGFNPANGSTYDIITAAPISSGFEIASLPLGFTYALVPAAGPTTVRLTYTAPQ